MLFNSSVFIFAFLPVTVVGYFAIRKVGQYRASVAWLVAASAIFYAWFSVVYLGMLAVLIVFNYVVGVFLSRSFKEGTRSRGLLEFGIATNLAVLGYFKYANFFIENLNGALTTHLSVLHVLLPIGISFFTFQKIAYLVDASRGEAEEYDLLEFGLFVMYFPQLIAGPIVHHKEIIPQFTRQTTEINLRDLAGGIALFAMGLIKKVVIADSLVGWSDTVFASAHAGLVPSLYSAWTGVLSFTFQIYFDFSGYTDMALGLALMMGIRLPLNFDSPYKSCSIIEFWRRWHITLSRFLRDYLYIPLGGNRHGNGRRFVNLMLTMLIGGLWHGAAWTFVIWGGLHGLYLIINHAWQRYSASFRLPCRGRVAGMWTARLCTFGAVIVAWVFFRAESFGAAINMLKGMFLADNIGLPTKSSPAVQMLGPYLDRLGMHLPDSAIGIIEPVSTCLVLIGLTFVVFLLPNSQQLLSRVRPALQSVAPPGIGRKVLDRSPFRAVFSAHGSLRLNAVTGALFGFLVFAALLAQSLTAPALKPFIYFQF